MKKERKNFGKHLISHSKLVNEVLNNDVIMKCFRTNINVYILMYDDKRKINNQL